MEKLEEITIYSTSDFFGSVVKHQGKLLAHGLRPYAQYQAVPYVDFIPKGKRKAVRIQKSYKPYLVIVKGYNAPEPLGMYGNSTVRNGVVTKESKYSSFDDRYKTDFDKVLADSNVVIIADYREGSILYNPKG